MSGTEKRAHPLVWLREGVEGVRHGGILMATLVAFVALVTAAGTWSDTTTAIDIVVAEQAHLDAGGDVLVAQRGDSTPISAAACARLAEIDGVRDSGAVTVGVLATGVAGLPEIQQSVVRITEGILGVLGNRQGVPDARAQGLVSAVVPPTVAAQRGLRPGSMVQLTGGDVEGAEIPTRPVRVDAIVDTSVLGEAFGSSVFLVQPPVGDASTCYVRVDAHARESLVGVVAAQLGDSATSMVQVSERLPTGAAAADPRAQWRERPTRWVGLAAGLIVAVTWSVVAWMRRGRAALAATIGVRYTEGVLIRWAEGATVVTVGCLWGVLLGGLAVTATGADPGLALGLVARTGALAWAVALGGVVLVGLGRPNTVAALKDR